MSYLRLLYVSTAASGLGQADLLSILATARRENAQNGVRGVLCASGGHFAQVLEGSESAVINTYARILEDPRHTDATLITIALTDEILYADWYMAAVPETAAAFSINDLLDLRSDGSEHDDALALMDHWLGVL